MLWEVERRFFLRSREFRFGDDGLDLGDATLEAFLGFFWGIGHVIAEDDVGLEQADGGIGGIAGWPMLTRVTSKRSAVTGNLIP